MNGWNITCAENWLRLARGTLASRRLTVAGSSRVRPRRTGVLAYNLKWMITMLLC